MVDSILVARLEDADSDESTIPSKRKNTLDTVDVNNDDEVISAIQGERIVLAATLRDGALNNDPDAQRLYLETLKHTTDTAIKRKSLNIAEKGLDALTIMQLTRSVLKSYEEVVTVEEDGQIPTPSKVRLTEQEVPPSMITYEDGSRTDSYKKFSEEFKDLSIIEIDEKDKES